MYGTPPNKVFNKIKRLLNPELIFHSVGEICSARESQYNKLNGHCLIAKKLLYTTFPLLDFKYPDTSKRPEF